MCVCARVQGQGGGGLGEPGTHGDGADNPFSLASGAMSFLPADLLLGGFCFGLMSHDKTKLARRGKNTRAPDGRSPSPGPLHAGTVPGFLTSV